MTDIETITLEAELTDEVADREIDSAVNGRHSVARKYVLWVRRRHPEATPSEVITFLERHYITAITVAGGLVSAGSIALDVGISLIPGGGIAKSATKHVARGAAKKAALHATRMGAQHVSKMLPAGDEQLQFEITALFALALADIHGMSLDSSQRSALVYGLANDGVDQGQITAMATDLARSTTSPVEVGQSIAQGQRDWSHWADTLARSLPAGAAQNLVRGMKTGTLEEVRAGLSGKRQAAVEYGAGALIGGVTRFAFGRNVVSATQQAFADPPGGFPPHLAIEAKESPENDDEANPALAALLGAARSTGGWLGGSAQTIGTGVGTVAGSVTRPFRGVDLDGDGIPDEPQALTAVKGVGGALAGAASTAAGKVRSPFRRRKTEEPAAESDAPRTDG
ncbi:hypothetical protein [Actinoplanes sp. NPDC051411]|uniref:hypothetical protein n=1 Tax=Actinoplanes sp. NPDC051411 TaxID=3155522 RepID=UPI003424B2C4